MTAVALDARTGSAATLLGDGDGTMVAASSQRGVRVCVCFGCWVRLGEWLCRACGECDTFAHSPSQFIQIWQRDPGPCHALLYQHFPCILSTRHRHSYSHPYNIDTLSLTPSVSTIYYNIPSYTHLLHICAVHPHKSPIVSQLLTVLH